MQNRAVGGDGWRGRGSKGRPRSAKEWVGFWLPGCSLEVVEEPESKGRRRRTNLTAPQANCKRLKRQGLEAYQSESSSAHFGTGTQRLEKGRKWALAGVLRSPSHGTSI